MKVEFDVKLQPKDMFLFNMYHTYHHMQGIIAIAMAVFMTMVTVFTWGTDSRYSIVCAIMAILFIVYIPLNLWIHAKMQLQRTPSMQSTQHYVMDDKGITIFVNDEHDTLVWNAVYRILETKSNILIYSSRVNAFVLPKREVGQVRDEIAEIAGMHLEKCRMEMK